MKILLPYTNILLSLY
ncbi:rCG63523 [Rattus norvegicus]|uniref:RCG63523 n=1 Tax=Rattus norvegicus TaxID=10116 RepID=A6IVB1_RAT|nr:rCG63523 [Rattus norvegicus]